MTRSARVLLSAAVVAAVLATDPAAAADLKVMKMGLGSGVVAETGPSVRIDCGADCDETFTTADTVVLTATADPGSTFMGWDQDPDKDLNTTADCPDPTPPTPPSATCTVTMSADHYLRPVFARTTPIPTLAGVPTAVAIQAYLMANPTVDTPGEFLKALPDEYKWNWLLMTRSESLQPGTAEFPRILLPNQDAQYVFTFGLAAHSAYPGAHPNAIEYMQWDPAQKSFRFHEIVVADISMPMGTVPPRVRQVYVDEPRCTRCHSTRNIPNTSPFIGTTGDPPGTVKAKNKPNWDTYDSWGGMLGFNRDRIYQGSVEAAAFRRLLNPWTWRANPTAREIMEQLRLQPPVPGVPAAHQIKRSRSGTNDGHVNFVFDGVPPPPVTTEPVPVGSAADISPTYEFNRVAGAGPGTNVERQGTLVTLHHSAIPGSDEGRAVHFFDRLGGLYGNLNQQRVADEVASHRHATGNHPIDVRPIAWAITNGCLAISGSSVTSASTVTTPLTIDLTFFTDRNGGMSANDVKTDTRTRKENLTRRKADIKKIDLDRTDDPYTVLAEPDVNGLLAQYGAAITPLPDPALMARLRQEVFRREIDAGMGDATVMSSGLPPGVKAYVDRELYGSDLDKVALYRYFLEPLGVSVDKWSMGVRGRSRTYTFADVFGTYLDEMTGALEANLTAEPVAGLVPPLAGFTCNEMVRATNHALAVLPDRNEVPTYTDVQRIWNKGCIECHGGLKYPPYLNASIDPSFLTFDLSENETPPPLPAQDRLLNSYNEAAPRAMSLTGGIYRFITQTDEDCLPGADDMMPCGGPPLSKVDIETVRRWIVGGNPYTLGDPHIRTIGGVSYDFQGAGEYVLLRGVGMEVQARHTAVETEGPLGPNGHTGLTSCVSLNTAAAVKVGPHRITYQPDLSGRPNPAGLELRIDGKLTAMSGREILLPAGGRIVRTPAPGGIQIEALDGGVVIITPAFWNHYQLWYLNIDTRQVKATEGLMGRISPRNWLPALPDGSLMGPRPAALPQRYQDLYEKFGKAWRVTAATSLFDYGPGTSTATFTIASWPLGESPAACRIPPRPHEPPIPRIPPLPTLTAQEAEQHCKGLALADLKALCIMDVRVTGEPGFAKAYELTEKIKSNRPPKFADLVSPQKDFGAHGTKDAVAPPVTFSWAPTSDPDGDPVTYRLCVWDRQKTFRYNACETIGDSSSSPPPIPGGAGGASSAGWRCALWVLLIGLLLLVVLYLLGLRNPVLLILLVIVILIVAFLAFRLCSAGGAGPTGNYSRTLAGPRLQPGRVYQWKVIAEDGKGASADSETWEIRVK
jgi:hypothetical protein